MENIIHIFFSSLINVSGYPWNTLLDWCVNIGEALADYPFFSLPFSEESGRSSWIQRHPVTTCKVPRKERRRWVLERLGPTAVAACLVQWSTAGERASGYSTTASNQGSKSKPSLHWLAQTSCLPGHKPSCTWVNKGNLHMIFLGGCWRLSTSAEDRLTKQLPVNWPESWPNIFQIN